jgi:hypothetical protein
MAITTVLGNCYDPNYLQRQLAEAARQEYGQACARSIDARGREAPYDSLDGAYNAIRSMTVDRKKLLDPRRHKLRALLCK